jgi:hypothetical protein
MFSGNRRGVEEKAEMHKGFLKLLLTESLLEKKKVT